jgi:hypothetical protein
VHLLRISSALARQPVNENSVSYWFAVTLSKVFSSPYFHTKVLHTLLIVLTYGALPSHIICLGSVALP